MVGTSKILTVSYGTFSCTLEGFDDSFSTMKAIAEYFRGLASDDRYFGAEPPTPDADMLAQIAEREISRRVDASMDDGGIHLRAAALTDQSSGAGDEAESQHDAESRALVEAERKAAKAVRKAEKAKAKAEAKAVKEAEKAAKAEAKADAKAEADASVDDIVTDSAEITHIESSESPATAELAEGTAGSEVEETRDVAPSSMLAAQDPAPTETAAPVVEAIPAHPDADSVAAKLQRIRAVVGKSGTAQDAPSNDLTAQFLPQSETPDVADVDSGASQNDASGASTADASEASQDEDVKSEALVEFDAHEAEMETATADADTSVNDTDGGSDMITRVMAGHSAPQDTAEEPQVEAGDAPPKAAEPQARIIRMKRADFDKAVQNGDMPAPDAPHVSNDGPDLGLLDGADELDEYLEDSDFTDGDLTGLDDTDFADDLAAIKADFEDDSALEAPAGVAIDDIEFEDVDEDAEAITETDDDASLSAIASAMATQVDVAKDIVEETVVEVEAETPEPEAAFMLDDPQVDESALDRLMSESDAQMQEPEGSRRRDAIAQLKAAVAAKEAARQVGEPEDDGQDAENAFRNDLSEAVGPQTGTARPRPVVRTATRTERPRPAPLKLVAAQRVDLDAVEKRDGPVVPRRVAAAPKDAAQTADANSFAEFAENMGASALPDLLEAAAAYTSFVEGADEFSRPQILRRVRAVASDDFNREDGLRSFADLLKLGRFTKVRNGRFQVADDSRYNPERRAG